MKHTFRALAVAGAISLAALGAATPALAQDAVIRVGQTTDLTSFDPTELRIGSYVSTFLLYNSLLRIGSDGQAKPELATDWSWSEDGRQLTVKLREDVRFHDGRPMTSADVAFSFQYAKTPEVGANVLPLARLIESIETPDDHTVLFTVTGSQEAIIDLLDLIFVIDATQPDSIKTAGNGTGPYRLDGHEPGQSTRFARNADYWGEAPEAERIEIRIVPDAQSAVAQLKSGAIDFLPVASREAIDQVAGDSKLRAGIAAPEGRVLDMLINVKAGAMATPELRQAINLALDRSRIAADVIGEGAVLKCLPWTERATAQLANYEQACRYDLEAARKLVEEAGLSGTNIELLSFAQAVPELGGMAQIVQYSLSQIGLNANIVDLSEAAVTQRYRAGEFELEAHTYARGGRSPETLLLTAVPFRPIDNPSGFDSEQYAADVATVTGVRTSEDNSAAAWTRINDFLLSEAWILPVASLPIRWVSSNRIDNVTFNLDGMPILATATFE
ncbi:ABC transporter substrate-binding protein [Devosia honganensis]|uniref:ABC transporter substrate-binding protein n=1 Tax=Devosia honganensis TaxID=1610527 RepID=A0ABV7X4T1_9HYPH